MRRYPESFELALTADDVERIFKKGKIASLIGMEGGHSIDNSLGALRMFYRLGARYMTLTHSRNTPWADSGDRVAGARRPDAVRRRGRAGDELARHARRPEPRLARDDGGRAARDAAPVIFSHSSARAVSDVPRNVPDNILRMLPKNGGVVMVTFVPGFLSTKSPHGRQRGRAERERLQQEFTDETAREAGSTSGDGAPGAARDARPGGGSHRSHAQGRRHRPHRHRQRLRRDQPASAGLENVSTYPALTAELLRRGYSDDDIRKILGLNVLRVMRQTEKVAATAAERARALADAVSQLDGRGAGGSAAGSNEVSAGASRIVAMGDSTTAGTPGFPLSARISAGGQGRPDSQYAYWLMRRTARVGSAATEA